MTKDVEVQIKLLKIKELSFCCHDILEDVDKVEIEENLKFALGFNFVVDEENDVINVETTVTFQFRGEELLKYENQISFGVRGIKRVIVKEGEAIKIKDDFLVTLINISIGTTRGLLAKTTLGKSINDFPIPILDSIDILKQLKGSKGSAPSE